MTDALAPDRELGEVALDLLCQPGKFTDLHVESNQPAMLRRSAGDWVEARDAQDRLIIVRHDRIMEFLDGAISACAGEDAHQGNTRWRYELNERGSLHPAFNLSRKLPDETLLSFRVRCTVQKQLMGEAIGLVLRPLREIPKSLESLGLPVQASGMLKAAQRGLIVVTGPTGAGKSTTLAAMVSEINESKRANILTIEDPVEFVHERRKAIINQRELGVDVASYEAGVRDALRFVPDVILIGEVRDPQTMMAALRAGISGHLVLTTMHAPTAVAAIRNMSALLQGSQADLQALGSCLVGVIAQALVKDKNDAGANHLAFELLHCRENKIGETIGAGDSSGQRLNALEELIRNNQLEGSVQPMMDSLTNLVRAGKVDGRSAAAVAVHPDDKKKLLEMRDETSTATNAVKTIATGQFFGRKQ